jgi:hypothetical protein
LYIIAKGTGKTGDGKSTQPSNGKIAGGTELRGKVHSSREQARLELVDTGDRSFEVFVLFECDTDQTLEFLVPVEFPPRHIRQGRQLFCFFSHAKRFGGGNVGTRIVGPHSACEQEQ